MYTFEIFIEYLISRGIGVRVLQSKLLLAAL